jgi:hypothetical protein
MLNSIEVQMKPYNPITRVVFNKFDKPIDKNAHPIYPYYLKKQLKKCNFRLLRHNYTVFFPEPLRKLIPLEKHIAFVPLGAHYYIMAEPVKSIRIETLKS